MAQVKGILVNDGGAPARIINFTAGEAISAGEVLKVNGSGNAALQTDNSLPPLGIALTDAASGAMISVVTGSGVVCYAITLAVTAGQSLATVDATPGALDNSTGGGASGDDTPVFVAIALETQTTVGALTKVMVV